MISFEYNIFIVDGSLMSVTSNDCLHCLMHSLVLCHRISIIFRRQFRKPLSFLHSSNYFIISLDENGPINPQSRIKIFSQNANVHFFLLSILQLHTMKTSEAKLTAKKNGKEKNKREEEPTESEQTKWLLKSHSTYFILFFVRFFLLFGSSFAHSHSMH